MRPIHSESYVLKQEHCFSTAAWLCKISICYKMTIRLFNYPKYLVTRSNLIQRRDGVKHVNIGPFMKDNRLFD